MSDQLGNIEKYLKGELSGDELSSFEADLQNDSSLKDKVDIHRELLNGLDIAFNNELKSLLAEEEAKIAAALKDKPKNLKSLYILSGMAAAVGLLIVSIFVLRSQSITPEELYAQNYQKYPNVEQPVSRSDDNDTNPYALYEKGEYEAALTMLTALSADSPLDPVPLFYAGMCQMELDLNELAITSFSQVNSLRENKYSRPSSWYLALSYLKSSDIDAAKKPLLELKDGNDVYAKKSTAMLSNL